MEFVRHVNDFGRCVWPPVVRYVTPPAWRDSTIAHCIPRSPSNDSRYHVAQRARKLSAEHIAGPNQLCPVASVSPITTGCTTGDATDLWIPGHTPPVSSVFHRATPNSGREGISGRVYNDLTGNLRFYRFSVTETVSTTIKLVQKIYINKENRSLTDSTTTYRIATILDRL